MAENEFKDFQSPHEASEDRLIEALDRAYHRPWLMLWRSFLQGLMSGMGALLGSFLIILLLGFAFNRLGGIAILNPVITKLQDVMTQSQIKTIKTLQASPLPSQP